MGRITGDKGAGGVSGGEALATELNRMAAEGGVKGFHARVSYLTRSVAGQEAMVRAGIDLSNRNTLKTVEGWLSDEEATTTRKYREAVDRAYEDRRRHNMAPSLKRRLSAGGGAQVEIHPISQSGVDQGAKRQLNQRRANVRPSKWDRIVDAWDRDDWAELDAEWEDLIADALGSDWGAYTMVSGVGIGA